MIMYSYYQSIMMTPQQYDYMAKTLIIGDSAVGKTSIIHQLTKHAMLPHSSPTLGLEFGMKNYSLDQEGAKKNLLLQLWDTAGSEQYSSLTDSFFKGAHVVVMTYSIDDRESYESIQTKWMPRTERHLDSRHIVTYLVGNKLDQQQNRQV